MSCGFAQWHAKSVREAQPSLVSAVVKHWRAQLGMSGRPCALEEATAAARARRAYENCILTIDLNVSIEFKSRFDIRCKVWERQSTEERVT
jgi:hypothetical protein